MFRLISKIDPKLSIALKVDDSKIGFGLEKAKMKGTNYCFDCNVLGNSSLLGDFAQVHHK